MILEEILSHETTVVRVSLSLRLARDVLLSWYPQIIGETGCGKSTQLPNYSVAMHFPCRTTPAPHGSP